MINTAKLLRFCTRLNSKTISWAKNPDREFGDEEPFISKVHVESEEEAESSFEKRDTKEELEETDFDVGTEKTKIGSESFDQPCNAYSTARN